MRLLTLNIEAANINNENRKKKPANSFNKK